MINVLSEREVWRKGYWVKDKCVVGFRSRFRCTCWVVVIFERGYGKRRFN